MASKGDKDEHKWVPEIKPRVREITVANALFRHLAFHAGEQVLVVTDDEKARAAGGCLGASARGRRFATRFNDMGFPEGFGRDQHVSLPADQT